MSIELGAASNETKLHKAEQPLTAGKRNAPTEWPTLRPLSHDPQTCLNCER
jgi:hypothetical protein